MIHATKYTRPYTASFTVYLNPELQDTFPTEEQIKAYVEYALSSHDLPMADSIGFKDIHVEEYSRDIE